MSVLFEALKLGSIHLKNRMVMAPLTRCRAVGAGRVPNELMVTYYRQRASAGFILTEVTSISPMAVGYANTPGIWSHEQIEGWKKVTEAVHNEGGVIFMQLWHVGRISHSTFLNGKEPVAPSAIRPSGHVSLLRPQREYELPRALELKEIKDIIAQYKQAAQNAKLAGFDGVELHAANGYLVDQFLQDKTNHRQDEYGGSIENRCRFLLEIVDELIGVWGADRVGVHLSPRCDSNDMGDSDPRALFTHVARELDRKKIAFIFTREYMAKDSLTPLIRQNFKGIIIANEKLNKDSAELLVNEGKADAVSFGVLFIANPDLPVRFKKGLPLNKPQFETFYAEGEKGYVDYPFFKET